MTLRFSHPAGTHDDQIVEPRTGHLRIPTADPTELQAHHPLFLTSAQKKLSPLVIAFNRSLRILSSAHPFATHQFETIALVLKICTISVETLKLPVPVVTGFLVFCIRPFAFMQLNLPG
jgi:hypothetical protein